MTIGGLPCPEAGLGPGQSSSLVTGIILSVIADSERPAHQHARRATATAHSLARCCLSCPHARRVAQRDRRPATRDLTPRC